MNNIIAENMEVFTGNAQPKSFANGDFHIIPSFGNTGVVETGEGLVIFDIGLRQFGRKLFERIRTISNKPIRYILYSHGHFDHAFGFKYIINEVKEKGWEMPEVIAHVNCVKRFEKYKILGDYHIWLNSQQFSSIVSDKTKILQTDTLDPTIKIRDGEPYTFKLGKYSFEVYPEWGETDDAIWMYCPEQKVIFAGDCMVSTFPNVGNPYKVQRYPKQWAYAMEHMLEKNAEYLIPGHGKLIKDKNELNDILSIYAEVMHFVHDEVVKRLNQGKWFEQIYHEMINIFPEKFKNHPYLLPLYGCYRFAIHSAYRLYHGWYNTGNPTDLFPAKKNDIARELLNILGSESEKLYIEHATKLMDKGKLQLALHILDVIINGVNESKGDILLEALKLKESILKQKADKETSFIGVNILKNGANTIKNRIRKLKK